MSEELAPKRGRGRPKGTGGNKRPDRAKAMSVNTDPGDNRKYIMHDMRMWKWPSVDMTKPEEVSERIANYFTICAEDDMKPSVAGMALAFGVSRNTLWRWSVGLECSTFPAESRDLVKKAYQLLNAQMENYMQNGKINPVAGIFLMKNNMGYKDQQEMVLTPNNPLGDQVQPETLQQKYLEATAADFDGET